MYPVAISMSTDILWCIDKKSDDDEINGYGIVDDGRW